jgi:hypothetical protein
VILIAYPPSHKYRVSAVFLECIANNKICFLSDIEALKNYMVHIKIPLYFKNINELIDCVNKFLQLDKEIIAAPFKDTEGMVPKFTELII